MRGSEAPVTDALTAQWFYSSVSEASLQKTGIFQWLSGECRLISEDDRAKPVSVETSHV